MTDPLRTLESVAASIFRERSRYADTTPEGLDHILRTDEPILREAYRTSYLSLHDHDELASAAPIILSHPDLVDIVPQPGKLGPVVRHPGGGVRASSSAELVTSLFTSAFLRTFYQNQPMEAPFVRAVVEGFEELCRAARGEQVTGYTFIGFAGVSLPEDASVETPWGILRRAPRMDEDEDRLRFRRPRATSIFAERRLVPIRFDRPEEGQESPPLPAPTESNATLLLPLACALASNDTSNPGAPVWMWSTEVLPFQFSYGHSWHRHLHQPWEWDFSQRVAHLERWAKTVHDAHVPSLDLAARRLVSAIAHRMEAVDALMDAVAVWENLVGSFQETMFRVTGSLVKIIEPDTSKRSDLFRQLKSIYGVRSKIAHGATVRNEDVEAACRQAIAVCIRALRVAYQCDNKWRNATSESRSNSVLLEWP